MITDLVPTDLTLDQKSQISAVIYAGCDWQTAAYYAGCRLADIRRAMQADPQFAMEVRRMQARCELNHMQTIRKAAEDPKNFRASMWWLERRAPERFGPRSAGAVTAKQLKAYIAILINVISGDDDGPLERAEVLERIRSFAESIDQLVRDETMTESEAIEAYSAGQKIGLHVDSAPALGQSDTNEEDEPGEYD